MKITVYQHHVDFMSVIGKKKIYGHSNTHTQAHTHTHKLTHTHTHSHTHTITHTITHTHTIGHIYKPIKTYIFDTKSLLS